MADLPENTDGNNNRLWTVTLTPSPRLVFPNDRLELFVTLHHPDLEKWTKGKDNEFLNEIRSMSYHSLDPRIDQKLRGQTNSNPAVIHSMPDLPEGDYDIRVRITFKKHKIFTIDTVSGTSKVDVKERVPEPIEDTTTVSVVGHQIDANVTLQRSASRPTNDQALWAAIRNRTEAISFQRYQMFIDQVFGQGGSLLSGVQNVRNAFERTSFGAGDLHKNILGTHAYSVLKLATQAFLTLECGVFLDPKLFDTFTERARFDDSNITAEALEERLQQYLLHPDSHVSALPYLKRIARAFLDLDRLAPRERQDGAPSLDNILRQRLTSPSMIELIWSYWQEEGMLVQTMNAIARRFQNRRGSEKDPLGELEFDSLRPLNNVLWGYIQDEQNRLTVSRRAHEYHHHYGISLEGKAVAGIYPADSRSKFIEAFHNLLYRTELFYREDRDTTMIADAFPLLNALKEVHLLLAEGAHNQFGDLTWTARGEMLITQWMLARPEMREFLRGRYAVPYQESWMGAVDAMKRLQGWGDTSITHFHELAVTGERILLSIRYGDWVNINNIEEQAKNWARNSKPEVQRYLFDYRTVTGVDLTTTMADTRDAATRFLQPSTLLQRRLSSQRTTSLPPSEPGLRALRPPMPAGADMAPKPMARLPRRGAGGDQ